MLENIEPDLIAALESCESFYLHEVRDGPGHYLKVVISEAITAKSADPIQLPGLGLVSSYPIEVTEHSRHFEFTFPKYVAYQVLNEGFALRPAETDVYSGDRPREFSASGYLTFIRSRTWTFEGNPPQFDPTRGRKRRHWEIITHHHVIDVISIEPPELKQINLPMRP